MLSPLLPRAADLERWADEYAAAGQLPRLIRRLIAASCAYTQLEFPADEAVRFEGWDGIASVTTGCAWVPDGVSGWELGCEARAKITRKATGDYTKRTKDALSLAQPRSTFVFVTPRAWAGKRRWVKARGTSPWLEVRALDAADLETWLETATSVHLWLAEIMGRPLDGAGTIESFWIEWARVSSPAITPDFLLAGREEVADAVRQRLTGGAGAFAVRADSPDEARAFIAAAADRGNGNDPLANVVVVTDRGTWRRLLSLRGQRFVLVPEFEEADVNGAVGGGHSVIHALGPDEPFSGTEVSLPPLNRDKAAAALIAAGVRESEANILAGEARRSLLAFRRQHAMNQRMRLAAWATPGHAHVLIPAMLAGSWDSESPGDRAALSELCGGDAYGKIEAELQVLAARADPPVRRIGSVWTVASKVDLWTQLANMAPPSVWPVFERMAADVACEPDPRLELAPDAKLMAIATAGPRAHSDRLRRGLIDGVALVGTRDSTTLLSDGRSPGSLAAWIVRNTTDRADADISGATWAAISDSLVSLAEASPETFVQAVDRAMRGTAIQRLIPDLAHQPMMFGVRVDHSALASALAMVAWDPGLFASAGASLATLANLVLDDQRRVSPTDHLVSVLLPWYPQTAASVDQRLDLLSRLQEREPDVAWRVLLKLIPNAVQTTSDTHHPRYRTWRAHGPRSVLRSEWLRYVEGISARLVRQAVAQPSRLPTLIENYADLAPTAQMELRDELERLDLGSAGVDRTAIADALREEVARHRAHQAAPWAMPADAVDELDRLLPALEPDDPIERSRWLFDDHPDIEAVSGEDYHNYDEKLRERRVRALVEILDGHGLDGVEALLAVAGSPRAVGLGLGHVSTAADRDILRWGESEDERHREAAKYFFASRVNAKGDDWAATLLLESCPLPPEIAGAFLATLAHPRRSLWALASRIGPAAEDAYWHDFYGFPQTAEEAEEAIGQLLERGRPYAAIDVLSMEVHQKRTLDPSQAIRALRLVAVTPPPLYMNTVSLGYDVSQVLGALEVQGVDTTVIAGLEWLFLPVLDHGNREPRALHSMLATAPEFFVQVLSAIYRAEDEDVRETTEEDAKRGELALRLLTDWHTPPGVGAEGSVDPEALVSWVRRARELAAESKRSVPGDSKIGAILRHVPAGSDGVWPHQAVRGLLEELRSDELENGMAIEVMNSRGVTVRGPLDGGAQEREIASCYTAAADALSSSWPRTAAMLRQLAGGFEEDAQRHDVDARIHAEDWG